MKSPIIRHEGRIVGVEHWACAAAREALAVCRTRCRPSNAERLHKRMGELLRALRSGSRRRTYRWLRAFLRNHRELAALRLPRGAP